ncbi:MAG: nitrogen regulation protein NR(II) [Phycisphaerales bacterium]
MTAADSIAPEAPAPPPTAASPDLAGVLSAFNAVSERLQDAHVSLQGEVRRLKRELRETNEQLRRSRQLAALGQMAAGIAHEIRNPLGSIRLFATMLADDLDDRPSSRETALKIDRAVRDLDVIVGDVLAFSREIRVNPAPLPACELCDHAIEMSRDLIEGRDITVRRDDRASSPLRLMVRADPLQIHLALTNVLRNAAEAAGHGGTIAIAAQASRLQGDDDGDDDDASIKAVSITISDTGPGVPEELLTSVFNPFFTTRDTGTGLGLAIAHRIVDAHGGQIELKNQSTGGASVTITLPAATTGQEGSGE